MMLALIGLAWPPLASAQVDNASPDAAAQSDQPSTAQPDQPSATPDQSVSQYSDDELRSFAAAALGVQQVKNTYGPMLAAATTSQEEQRMIRMAGAEMVRAVEDQGISIERFQAILEGAATDPALIERINRHLNEPR